MCDWSTLDTYTLDTEWSVCDKDPVLITGHTSEALDTTQISLTNHLSQFITLTPRGFTAKLIQVTVCTKIIAYLPESSQPDAFRYSCFQDSTTQVV